MNQSIPREANPISDDDAHQPAEHPNGVLAKLRLRSAENPVMAMVGLSTMVCLAGWGALSIFYQFACWFFGPANAGAIVAGTVMSIAIGGMLLLVWWCGDRIERFFGRKRATEPTAPPQQGLPFWKDWKTFIAAGILYAVVKPSMRPQQHINPSPGPINTSVSSSKEISPQESVKQWSQQRQATSAYWQTAVANLHLIRFQMPSGDEAAGSYADRLFQQLQSLLNAAKSASTASVDPSLIDMTRRHLAIDDQLLGIKAEIDALMKREKISSDTVAVGQRVNQWQSFIERVQADPSLLENLPEGPERTVIEKMIELELQRLEQLREIEIMQAVLQERYRGTQFALPEISP